MIARGVSKPGHSPDGPDFGEARPAARYDTTGGRHHLAGLRCGRRSELLKKCMGPMHFFSTLSSSYVLRFSRDAARPDEGRARSGAARRPPTSSIILALVGTHR